MTSQEMAINQNGTVAQCDHREYGFAQIQVSKINGNASVDALFEGLGDDMQVRSNPYLSFISVYTN
jgi:GMP synthase (glutamine-hydrolysing)